MSQSAPVVDTAQLDEFGSPAQGRRVSLIVADTRSRSRLLFGLVGIHHHPRGRSAAAISDHTKHVPDLRAPGDLLTADELATKLRRSRDWVYRRARAGALPGALRLDSGWRFRKADIDAWLAPGNKPNPPTRPVWNTPNRKDASGRRKRTTT